MTSTARRLRGAPVAGFRPIQRHHPARRPARAPAPRCRRGRPHALRRASRSARAVTAASDTRSSRLCSSTGSSGRGSPLRRNWKKRPGISKPATSPTRRTFEQRPLQRRQAGSRRRPDRRRAARSFHRRRAGCSMSKCGIPSSGARMRWNDPARLHHRHVERLAVVGDDQIRVVEALRRPRRAARARRRSW